MNFKIKPFEAKYTYQCAELQKYLWGGKSEERLKRFKWTYLSCPNNKKPLSIIAVNEQDEIIGFRGYFLNKFSMNNKDLLIAQIGDTVVFPEVRRRGIFQKMTDFSFNHLRKNHVTIILNLGPSWPSYYGNKKLGFADLASFNTSICLHPINLIKQRFIKSSRDNYKEKRDMVLITTQGSKHFSTQQLSDNVMGQIEKLNNSDLIKSSKEFYNLKWRTQRPNKNYIYCYSLDNTGFLLSFVMMSTSDFYHYDYGLMLSDSIKNLKQLIKTFRKQYKPSIETAWNFALDKKQKKQLRCLKFMKIPFLNKIRKNPPAMVFSLKQKEDGTPDWLINNIDIRDINNWLLTKLDKDSF